MTKPVESVLIDRNQIIDLIKIYIRGLEDNTHLTREACETGIRASDQCIELLLGAPTQTDQIARIREEVETFQIGHAEFKGDVLMQSKAKLLGLVLDIIDRIAKEES